MDAVDKRTGGKGDGVRKFLMVVLLVGGCAAKPPLTTGDGTYAVQWSTVDEAPIDANKWCDIRIQIETLKGSGDDLSIRFDATMPAHRHGMNVVVTPRNVGPNEWVVEDVLMHMPGEWALDFDITDSNGVVHRAREIVVIE